MYIGEICAADEADLFRRVLGGKTLRGNQLKRRYQEGLHPS